MPPTSEDNVLRPVGMLEKLYTARQVLGIYNSVVITATYKIDPNVHDNTLLSTLNATIPRLLNQHPSLCCYVPDINTLQPVFKRLQIIKSEDVLQVSYLRNGEDFSMRLQELHDEEWSVEAKPLWKIAAVRESNPATNENSSGKVHLAFVFHHVIGDGLSGAAFHRALFEELQTVPHDQALQGPTQEFIVPSSTTLIEPVEKLLTFHVSWTFLLSQVFKGIAPSWLLGKAPTIWTGPLVPTIQECPYITQVRLAVLPSTDVKTLINKSKENGVSLNSLLTSAIAFTLAKALPSDLAFVGTTPYTMRKVIGTSMDAMVNQTSAIMTTYSSDLLDHARTARDAVTHIEALWAIAKHVQAEIHTEIANCPRNNIMGLLHYVSDYVEFYRKKFGKARDQSWELSNLGVFKPNPASIQSKWELEQMIFTQGATPAGPPLNVNSVGVDGGLHTLAITWQKDMFDESIVDALISEFTDLAQLLRSETA